ncbi:MAG TPA: M23 family metallopeptidase [Acidimicrobiales bacterium]|nr:M23 family metallopeptidase [Acidimicrobiales bacterium]
MKSARLSYIGALAALLVAGSAAGTTYTLRRGDTLSRVGSQYGVSVSALAVVNHIPNPDLVMEGRTLTVPDARTAQVAVATPIAAVVGNTSYKVRAGDTLTSIASRFGTTISALARANGIADSDMVREGRTLKVPTGTGSASAPSAPAGAQTPICPVQNAGKWDVSNGFGSGRETGRHMGDDIFAKRGTPVLASVDGTIRYANGKIAGNAYYLVPSHGGPTFYGAHLDAFVARPGHVNQGDLIGYVGNTGDAATTPTHLHFEVKPDGRTSVDPYAFLRSWCTGSN